MATAKKPRTAARPRILCVDDEPMILAGLEGNLRRQFEVVTAEGGYKGLEALSKQGPFTVILSDFAMPGMNGAQFLAQARLLAPDAVRVLLTGQASIEGAIAAVNAGNIFRFLMKPCAPEALLQALGDAVELASIRATDRALMERKLDALSAHLLRVERKASLGTMASAVGHELNNVLTVLVSSLDFIQDAATRGQPPSPADLEGLEHVRKHLAIHAKNLLRFGQPAEPLYAVANADLCEMVADAISLLRTAGILRHAELELLLPPDKQPVCMARSELEQVLVNLLKNAVDATATSTRQPAKIGVAVERSEDGKSVRCTVRDNGTGIPSTSLPLIFEPYFSTKPADQGNGLGLFVVKQIVERCGGTVQVQTEEGLGSAFSFELPGAPAT